MRKIKLTEQMLTNLIKKVVTLREEELGGMTSDPRIMAREYGETPESPESKVAEQIFQLFDHKIGEWTISPDHSVTQETQKYLADWKEDVKSQLEVIINTAISKSKEEDIDDELMTGPWDGGDEEFTITEQVLYTCQECGTEFELPEDLADHYADHLSGGPQIDIQIGDDTSTGTGGTSGGEGGTSGGSTEAPVRRTP
jgi:hypothetical protein